MTALYEFTWSRKKVAEVESRTVKGPADLHGIFAEQFAGLDVEHMKVAMLNARNTVIGIETVYVGNVSQALIRVGELFRGAIRMNASRIVIAHNHPSGDATPSPDDLHLTAEVVAAGRLLDIQVLDHIIVADDGYQSLRDRGVAFER